jgi:hypothetical protein
MPKVSYSGYRFPPEIIHQAIWLYLRFTLSLRDVEDLLAERGIVISYETVRRWVNHFGPIIAAELRKRRPKPHAVWHLDEVYLKIDGRKVYLWRAVDAEVLDVLVQSKRNKHAALKLMRKLLKKYVVVPNSGDPAYGETCRPYLGRTSGLGQQFHGGVDEVVPQISRFRHQAGGVRAVDYQRYLRRDAVGITNAQPGDDGREPGPHFLLVGPSGDPAGMVLVRKLCRQVQEGTTAIGGTPDPPRDFG